VMLYSIYHFFKTRKFIESIKFFIPTLIVVLFVFGYYKINGGYDPEKQTTLLLFNDSLNYKGVIIKMLNRVYYSLLFMILLYLPFLMLLIFEKNKIKRSKLFLIVLFIILSSLGTRLLLEGFNTPQFVTYVLPILNVFVLYCFYQNFKNLKFILLFALFGTVINFYSTYFHVTTRRNIDIFEQFSVKFVQSVSKEIENNRNKNVGYFLANDIFHNIQPGFWFGYYPCEFLIVKDCFNFYSLNFPNLKYEKNSSLTNDFSPNHLRFLLEKDLDIKTYEREIVPFIVKNNIHYIVAKKSSILPFSLHNVITDSIVDSTSGDRFLRLDKRLFVN
jgi:hypothetical protein